MIVTIPNESVVNLSITISGRLTCQCPVGGRTDFATVEVNYRPSGLLIELASFSEYLATFRERSITHEVLTGEIQATLAELLDTSDVIVCRRWAAVEGIDCVVTTR